MWAWAVSAVASLTGAISQAAAGNWWAAWWAVVSFVAICTALVAMGRWLRWRTLAEGAHAARLEGDR